MIVANDAPDRSMIAAALAFAVLSTATLQGDAAGSDAHYILEEFDVPEGTVEIAIDYAYEREPDILDFAVWGPGGFRGYSGGSLAPIVIGVDASSDGYLTGAIPPGNWTLVVGRAAVKSAEVSWSATIECRDQATLEAETFADHAPVVLRDQPGWYAGDLHVHSEQSPDSSASLDDILGTARQQELDFVVLSDHNNIKQHGLIAERQKSEDEILLVRGNEVTTYEGHGNAIGLAEHVDFRLGVDEVKGSEIVEAVTDGGGLFIINHPVIVVESCIGCGWELDVNYSKVHGVEIHFGNYDVGVTIFTRNALAFWEDLSERGLSIAAVGGSDDHEGGQGTESDAKLVGSPTTWVYADDLSEESLMQGIRDGRTIVQLRGLGDPFAELEIRGAESGVGMVGDSVVGHEVTISAHITGGDGASVNLYADGEVYASDSVAGDDWTFEFVAPVRPQGSRYHLGVGSGYPQLVTSHVYATYAEPPADSGCGCQTGERGASLWLLLSVLGLLLRRGGRQQLRNGQRSSSRSEPRRRGR